MSTEKPILRKIRFKTKNKSIEKNTAINNTASDTTNNITAQQNVIYCDDQSFSCVICQHKFETHNLLIAHFRMHGRNEIDLKGRPILETATKTKSDASITIPTNELIECEWCAEAFFTISKAIQHKFRKHRYESTNYFCKLCGKLFPLNCALKHHIQVEHDINETANTAINNLKTKEPNELANVSFSCSICNVSFLTKSALSFHEKGAHQIEYASKMIVVPPPSKKIRITKADIISLYYCHLCGTEYILKYNLRKHIQNCHTEIERNTLPENGIIKCKACEAYFYTEKAYEIHNRHHTPEDLYVENEEQRQKLVTRVDQDFDIRRVPVGGKEIAELKMVKDLMRIQQNADSNSEIMLSMVKQNNTNTLSTIASESNKIQNNETPTKYLNPIVKLERIDTTIIDCFSPET